MSKPHSKAQVAAAIAKLSFAAPPPGYEWLMDALAGNKEANEGIFQPVVALVYENCKSVLSGEREIAGRHRDNETRAAVYSLVLLGFLLARELDAPLAQAALDS